MQLHKITPKLKPSLRWSNQQRPLIAQIAVSSLGFAGPIAIGAMTGQIGAGMAASMGGLAMAAAIPRHNIRQQITGLTRDLIVTGSGFAGGLFLSGNSLALLTVILCAALLSSSTRSMPRQMNLLVIFFLIGSGIKVPHQFLLHFSMLFLMGGAWSGLLSLMLVPLFRLLGIDAPASAVESTTPVQSPHWLKSLQRFSGWQYTLRLAGCMTAGTLIGNYFVPAHTYWILLTVFLVQDRHFPASMRKTFDRGVGTVAGVVLISPVISLSMPVALLIALIFILAAVRPVLKSANYLAYSMIMTPLIMLIMSFGHEEHLRIALSDRLIATMIACALVLVSDKFVWHHFSKAVQPHQNITSSL